MCVYTLIDEKIKDSSFFHNVLKRNESKSLFITFLNPFSYQVFLKKPELIHEFDAFFADGALLVVLHNLFHNRKIDRVSFDFSSIANEVLSYASNNDLSIALIGAKYDELQTAISNLVNLYPSLNIVYSRHGYFNSEAEYKECFSEMRNLNISILIIGMGSPYQEEFAIKVKKQKLNIPLVFTCGGFLTQTSIKTDYYHPIAKKLGLRWLQRAILHKHVRNRLLKDYPIFLFKYIFNHFRKKC